MITEAEFNEFEPRLKSAKNRFQLSAGLNIETLKIVFEKNERGYWLTSKNIQ